MKKSVVLILFSLILILLFMFAQPMAALDGAKTSLLLWFHSLLPSLLPFMILSQLLILTNGANYCSSFLYPPLHKIFGCSREGSFALVIGFLCGFPMGAKTLSDLRHNNRISKQEGDYLLGFCNNFSPMFVLSYLGPNLQIPQWKILLIVFGSPLLWGLLSRFFYRSFSHNTKSLTNPPLTFSFSMIDQTIMSSFSAITKLGGYLILFGIFTKMVTALPTVTILKSHLISLTEITNGISFTAALPFRPKTKALILLPGLCLGGLSGLAQTKSMISETDLSLAYYAFSRLTTFFLSLMAALVLC